MAEYDPFATSQKNILALLSTDLNVALTFAQIAGDPHSNPETRRRNILNAKKAYDSTVEWLRKLNTTPEEHPQISRKLNRLRSKLQLLGVTSLS